MEPTQPQSPPKSSSSQSSYIILGIVVLVILVVAGYYFLHKPASTTTQTPTTSATNKAVTPAKIAPAQVSITKTGFVPATVSVQVGQAVVWVNNDTAQHLPLSDTTQTSSSAPYIDAHQALSPNDSYSYIFNKAGTYAYHDKTDPSLQGVVIVK